jgi:hypothetical protein
LSVPRRTLVTILDEARSPLTVEAALRNEAEFCKRVVKTLDISRGQGEENVDVFGKPHVPVKGNGVPTDNHVVNLVRFE